MNSLFVNVSEVDFSNNISSFIQTIPTTNLSSRLYSVNYLGIDTYDVFRVWLWILFERRSYPCGRLPVRRNIRPSVCRVESLFEKCRYSLPVGSLNLLTVVHWTKTGMDTESRRFWRAVILRETVWVNSKASCQIKWCPHTTWEALERNLQGIW